MRKATGNGSGIKGGISQRKEVLRTRRARGINPPQTSGLGTLTSQVSRVEVGCLVTEGLSVPAPTPASVQIWGSGVRNESVYV